MSLSRVKALAKKEFIQILRDYRSLGMAFVIPVLLLALFGYALTLDVDHVLLAVWDQDRTPLSRGFLLDFSNSPYFKVTGYYDTYAELEERINDNRAVLALVVPRDFSQLLRAGRAASVQLIADGSDSNTASIAVGYVNSIISAYNKRSLTAAMSRHGGVFIEPLRVQPRVWFNEDLKSKNFIVPGLIAVIMTIIAALLTSLTVSREWERGTMEQLISTPVKPGELILGKFIPYFVIGIIDVMIAFAMAAFVFHIPFRGSVALFFILSGLFLTGVLCWGILISVIMKNQLVANQVAFITTFLPAFLLSGFAFPLSNMPRPIEILTHIIPARYFVTISKGIYLKGVGLKILWPQVLLLALFSALMILLATKKFKKTVV